MLVCVCLSVPVSVCVSACVCLFALQRTFCKSSIRNVFATFSFESRQSLFLAFYTRHKVSSTIANSH